MKFLWIGSLLVLARQVFATPISQAPNNLTVRDDTDNFNIANLREIPHIFDERRYCATTQPPKCTFASRINEKGDLAEWFLFDHWCNIIGHWGNNLVPTDGSPFFTPLKHPIWPNQTSIAKPPKITYKGVVYEYTGCRLAGLRTMPYLENWPGVRLACWVRFDCPWEG